MRQTKIAHSAYNLTRNKSFSSSISSRTPSVSSRNTSNSSFSSSVGPGHSRSTSAHGGSRYHAPTSFNQSTYSRPTTAIPNSRPASSFKDEPTSYIKNEPTSSDEEIPTQNGRQRMQLVPSLQSSVTSSRRPMSNQGRRLQSSTSMQSLKSQRSLKSIREVSVSTAMSRLRLDDGEYSPPPSNRKLSHNPFISNNGHGLGNNGSEGTLVLFEPPEGSLVAPQTPSQIPVPSKRYPLDATPSRKSKTSPRKSTLLTNDSNEDQFIAWDVRGRLEDMEAMYFDMKDKMAGTNMERSGLEEAVTLYKAKGQCLLPVNAKTSTNHQQSPNSKTFDHNCHLPIRLFKLT